MCRYKIFCQVSKLWVIITNCTALLQVIDKLANESLVRVITQFAFKYERSYWSLWLWFRGAGRPTVFGTDFGCVVGSTVLIAVDKLTVWALASVAVEVLTGCWQLGCPLEIALCPLVIVGKW